MGRKRFTRMLPDDLAWERSDQEFEDWERTIYKNEIYQRIGKLIAQHRGGEPLELHRPVKGGYNVIYRMDFKDGSAIMRIPCPGIVQFPEEKVRIEVATMRYITKNTTIPVPKVYHYGRAHENPSGLGPYIIMEYIEHSQSMSDALRDPNRSESESRILDLNISTEKLENLYGQMANIILQLSALEFPRIGSLTLNDDNDISWNIAGRPLIQNMNSLIEHARVPSIVLPSETQTYSTADAWYSALADMHMAQLTFQHNDAIDSEADAQEKYVARQLFRRLAAQNRLASGFKPADTTGAKSSFKLWCEDLRPSNVLLDSELRVVGVVDWEFTYAAPAQFTFDPPWWLLLEQPEYWSGGYMSWMQQYEPRFWTFLRVLEAEERKIGDDKIAAQKGGVSQVSYEKSLSEYMRESWGTGTYWLSYAARKSWAFDAIFWKFLDKKFFGDNETNGYESRLEMVEESKLMERFVERKVKESKERVLIEWDPDEAKKHLTSFLV